MARLTRNEICYGELKSGQKGINISEEDWFLLVKKNQKWKLALLSLAPYEAITSMISLDKIEDLRTSRKAEIIRDNLKRWANWSDILEWTIIEIQYHKNSFSRREDEDDEEEEVVITTPRVISEDFIAEQVWKPPNSPEYVVSYFDREELSYEKRISLGETDIRGRPIVYKPIFNAHLRKGMVILPRAPAKCNLQDFISEANEFVREGFDACGKNSEVKLLILTAIASWTLDKERPDFPIAGVGVFAPILAIRGPSGSGKNRLANLLRFLSYHPFFDVSTYRIPSLYRPLDQWKGTLVVDEGDFRSTNETSSLIHFLNARATGTPIGRQNPDRPSKCDAFESFGLTIITQRRHFEDNATEGRTIPFYTDVSERALPTLETEDMIKKGMQLQDKLLYLRLRHWNEIKIDKTLWINGISDHRLNSSLLPIMALSKFAPWLKKFVENIVKPIEKERRKLKAQSEDGVLINVLWEKIDSGFWGIHNGLYYLGEGTENATEELYGEDITIMKPLTTSNLAEALKRSSKTIRKILTSLNIAPDNAPARFRVGRFTIRGIFFDPKKLEKRLREFVIEYEKNQLFKTLETKEPVPGVPNVPVTSSLGSHLLKSYSTEIESSAEMKPGTSGTNGTNLTRGVKQS